MSSNHSGALRSSVMTAAAHVDENARYPPSSSSTSPAPSYTLFFYGTLVHPAILSRMIGHDASTLHVQPAILPGYALHHVKGEEYPALITLKESKQLLASSNDGDEALLETDNVKATAVRGSLVSGLSEADVRKLDLFEGDEYIRTCVEALPDQDEPVKQASSVPRDQSIAQTLVSLTQDRIRSILANPPQTRACHVYGWYASREMLEPRIWSFETFISSGNHTKWWKA